MGWLPLAAPSGLYIPHGVALDGTSGGFQFNATSALTGSVDGKQITLSTWFQATDASLDASTMHIFISTDSSTGHFGIRVYRGGDDTIGLLLYNAAGTLIFNMNTSDAVYFAGMSWVNILMSADLLAGTAFLYINDVAKTVIGTNTNDTISFTRDTNLLPGVGGSKCTGNYADFWLNPGFMDFSVTANRRKFIDGSGNAVSLGSTGQTPTGSTPLVFFTGATSAAWNNVGTGGAFTQTGTPTDSGTNPP